MYIIFIQYTQFPAALYDCSQPKPFFHLSSLPATPLRVSECAECLLLSQRNVTQCNSPPVFSDHVLDFVAQTANRHTSHSPRRVRHVPTYRPFQPHPISHFRTHMGEMEAHSKVLHRAQHSSPSVATETMGDNS